MSSANLQMSRRWMSDANGNSKVLAEIDKQVKASPCTMYMKGTPASPRCGFSGMAVKVLNAEGAVYQTYDVLSDDNLRTYVKEYSNWPTFPQVYIGGQFVGGCDLLVEMHQSKELHPLLEKAGALKKD